MLATLALTLLVAKPQPAITMSPQMARELTLAAQQYGPPPAPVHQLSNATGLYLSPTDDIWVYANATDPQKDEYLRAWGKDGRAIPLPGDDPQAYSWSILKWDLSGFGDKTKIVDAQLILTQVADAGYTAKDAAAAPLEVRGVKSDFSESGWNYADADRYAPQGAEGEFYGQAAPAVVSSQPFKITIDLMNGPDNFRSYFDDAMKKGKVIALAIASRIDPSKLGREAIYKVYSKDAADPTVRPALRFVLDDSGKKAGKS